MRQNQFIYLIVIILSLFAQKEGLSQPQFIENKGQFEPHVEFKLDHAAGRFYFQKDKVTYQLFDKHKIDEIRHAKSNDALVQTHTYETVFLGANQAELEGIKSYNFYENYFIGNDSTKWANKVPIYKEVKYLNIYDGVDLHYYEKFGHLKYDFIVHPKQSVKEIKIQFNGLNKLYLKAGHLVLETALGNVIEQAPVAYQIIKDQKIEIPCKYVLNENVISFKLLKPYNKKYPLIIDPVLIFSTYSGSSAMNWGQTATYDNSGHLYAGSISFAIGYPTTLGPFQQFFGGGNTDMCIT